MKTLKPKTNYNCIILIIFFCLFYLMPFFEPNRAISADNEIVIGTSGPNGVYYPTGMNICEIVNRKSDVYGFTCSAITSNGSVYNINNVLSNDLQLGMAQSDIQFQAVKGMEEWEGSPQENLRSCFSIYPESVTLITRAEDNIRQVSDLMGKHVYLGGRRNAIDALSYNGIDYEKDIIIYDGKHSEAVKEFINKDLDAIFLTVGHPNQILTDLIEDIGNQNIYLVPIGNIGKILQDNPFYISSFIPISFYTGISNQEDVATFGLKATLVTSKQIDADTIYYITKEIFDNFEEFKNMHQAYSTITQKTMFDGLTAPFHDGANKFYNEDSDNDGDKNIKEFKCGSNHLDSNSKCRRVSIDPGLNLLLNEYSENVYSNASFNGIWMLVGNGISQAYIVGDGEGVITRSGCIFNIDDYGDYNVTPDGTFTCQLYQNGSVYGKGEGNFENDTKIDQFIYADEEIQGSGEIHYVTDLSIWQGAWSGTLQEISGQGPYNIEFTVNKDGEVTFFTGLPNTPNGYCYALTNGKAVCWFTTNNSNGPYSSFAFRSGSIINDTFSGICSPDAGIQNNFNIVLNWNSLANSEYEVWGGNEHIGDYETGYEIANSGYTLIGSSKETKTFNGSYSYYVVAVRRNNTTYIDTVQDSNGLYYRSFFSGNTPNIIDGLNGEAPDGDCVTVGGSNTGATYDGFFLIEPDSISNSIIVYVCDS